MKRLSISLLFLGTVFLMACGAETSDMPSSKAAAQGERFIASMSADLSDKNGNLIHIDATFNADAGYQSFDECPVT